MSSFFWLYSSDMPSDQPHRLHLVWYPIGGDEAVAERFVSRATDKGVDRSLRVVKQTFHRP